MQRLTRIFFIITWMGLLLTGCDSEPAATPTAVSPTSPSPTTAPATTTPAATTADGVVISEVLVGVDGNNNQDFIELYNASSEAIDLAGWSLWYHLRADQEPQLLVSWQTPTAVPPLGHYLLRHERAELDLIADAVFDVGLFDKGGLILRDGNGRDVDVVGWGDAPDGAFAGAPAASPAMGSSLERLPAGAAGNGQTSGSNAADFAQQAPNPQNTGSPLTPAPDAQLALAVSVPETITPGSEFDVTVAVTNASDTAVPAGTLALSLPIPDQFALVSGPEGGAEADGRFNWIATDLPAGDTAEFAITLQAPFTYVDVLLTDVYAEADGFLRAYGGPQVVAMAGGAIPIATARELAGSVVSIEGTATMYTGGFFAGSTGNKFYLQDETGGIQVYVPGGQGQVSVDIGDRVRVTGLIEPYRDSLEIIPVDIPADVEIIGAADVPAPLPVSVEDVNNSDAIVGELVVIEGTAVAIEEFSFDFQVQLDDGSGETAVILIEKDTGTTAELMEVGQDYRIIGISEFYQTVRQVKPRLQSDIQRIFPPVVLAEMRTDNNVLPGGELQYIINIYNYTAEPLTNLTVIAEVPDTAVTATTPEPSGIVSTAGVSDGVVTWVVDELGADGESIAVAYTITLPDNPPDIIAANPASVSADQLELAIFSNPFNTFIGEGVPIWAIQGDGERSPYARSNATTQGIVTGVFPDLGGFWMQMGQGDGDPDTSDAIFVFTDNFAPPVAIGDAVQVTGQVREVSQQTLLDPATAADIVVLSNGNDSPALTVWDPPQDPAEALVYNESLEGMLVVVDSAVAIAPTTRFGEYALVNEKWGVDSVRRTDDVGYLLFVDDGSSIAHEDASTLPYTVARGDVVSNLVGPLAYTFGQYKIEPTSLVEVAAAERPLPSLPITDAFSVATFNVENFFDVSEPHPSSPPKPLLAEYETKVAKIAAAIEAMGAPTIIGMQEVENIGVLEDVAAQLIDYGYVPYLIEGFDSRGIDNGYLVREDQVTVLDVSQAAVDTAVTSRPPLVLTVEAVLGGETQTVVVANNHFTSLSAGEEATEPIRTAQAALNVAIIEEIRAANPDALFIVMGDLNSFYQTLPIDTLQDVGLNHVYEFFGDGELPYTYIFEGRTQTLDHILMSPELFAQVADVQALHINAGYPLAAPDDASAQRSSDHDPLVVVFGD